MALFGGRRPTIPSFVDVSLDGLMADPMWRDAVARAGLSIDRCDLAVRVGASMIGTGFEPGSPHHANPALLLGQDDILAIVFPTDRELRVVTRPKRRAQLQTQRSGTFQLIYGPVDRLDVWMFNELNGGTPEGVAFGDRVLAFLNGRPPEVAQTPPAPTFDSSPNGAAGIPPIPASSTPLDSSRSAQPPRPTETSTDETVERVVHRLAETGRHAVHLQTTCYEKGEDVIKGYGASNQPGIHPIARDRFLGMAREFEREFGTRLMELKKAQAAHLEVRANLLFLVNGNERDVSATTTSLLTAGRVTSEEFTNIALGTAVANTDFGADLQTFMDANGILFDRLKASGMFD